MRHTLSILVENRFGELARIVGLFSARGLDVESLCVAETLDPGLSHITLVTSGGDAPVEQITRQIDKQVRVRSVADMNGVERVERELALVDVRAAAGPERQEVLSVVKIFRARVVDMSDDALVVEVTGDRSKVSALISLLEPLGIRGMVRTGAVALARPAEEAAAVFSKETR